MHEAPRTARIASLLYRKAILHFVYAQLGFRSACNESKHYGTWYVGERFANQIPFICIRMLV